MRSVSLTIAALLLLSNPARATSVVAVWTPTAVVIGADSKINTIDRSATSKLCKLHALRDVVWSSSGILQYRARNFNVDDIVAAELSSDQPIDAAVKKIEAVAASRLAELLRIIRVENPAQYPQFETVVLQIVIGAKDRAGPRLRVMEFANAPTAASAPVSIDTRIWDCPAPFCAGLAPFALGRSDAVLHELSMNPSIWETLGLSGAIRHLIETEISDQSSDVGPPVAIAELTDDGVRWISKGVCQPP